MSGTLVEVQSATITPAVQNSIASLNINTTPSVVDLTSLPSPFAGLDAEQKNVVGRYVRVSATLGTVYYATGNANQLNALSNINAANFSTFNATSHQLTLAGTECEPIPAGTFIDVDVLSTGGTPKIQNPQGANSAFRYIALVTLANTAVVTLRQSST